MQSCYCVVRGPALFIGQTRRHAVWCAQRLMRDFKRLQQDPPQGVNASPNADNIMLWNAVIFGPEDTPWDGGELLCRRYSRWSGRGDEAEQFAWLQARSGSRLSFLRSTRTRRRW